MNNLYRQEDNKATCKLIVLTTCIKSLAGILIWALSAFVWHDEIITRACEYFLLPFYVISIPFFLILKKVGFEKESVKFILFIGLIISISVSYLIFGYFSVMFIVIPLIISARALDRREALIISALTCIFFSATLILNIYLHRISNTIYELHMYQNATIWGYPKEVFYYYFLPVFAAFVIVTLITDSIIVNGKKQIKRNMEQVSKIAVLNTELATAAQIQQNALPSGSFTVPGCSVTLKAGQKPAKQVGGDFYDYFITDKDHLVFLVADVSDKGISAAMFMMAAQKTLRIAIQENKDLSQAISVANRLLCQNNADNMFLTLWAGVLDMRTFTLEYVNCGHPFPVLTDSENNLSYVENKPNIILGCFENATYKTNRLSVKPNTKLIIFTDGITDIRNEKDKDFGNSGLEDAVKNGITEPADLIDCCKSFAGNTPQFDDMTVMKVCF